MPVCHACAFAARPVALCSLCDQAMCTCACTVSPGAVSQPGTAGVLLRQAWLTGSLQAVHHLSSLSTKTLLRLCTCRHHSSTPHQLHSEQDRANSMGMSLPEGSLGPGLDNMMPFSMDPAAMGAGDNPCHVQGARAHPHHVWARCRQLQGLCNPAVCVSTSILQTAGLAFTLSYLPAGPWGMFSSEPMPPQMRMPPGMMPRAPMIGPGSWMPQAALDTSQDGLKRPPAA